MSLEDDVRRLLDLEAIRDLARRYAHYVWTRDVAAAIDLFTEDGEMDTGTREPIRGRRALLEVYGEMLGPAMFQPFVHNHVIQLDGDRATGVCYLDLRATVDGKSMIGAGHYDDVCVRDSGAWKFKLRRLRMDYFVPIADGWAGPKG